MAESMAVNGVRPFHQTNYPRDASGVSATSPSVPVFRSDIFGAKTLGSANGQYPVFGSFTNPGRLPVDRPLGVHGGFSSSFSGNAPLGNMEARLAPAIIIRRLSRNIGSDALGSMLIFAGDLIDTEFIRSPYPEDQGFATAVARFRSQSSALDAQQKLHGKPNTARDANLIVEVHTSSMGGPWDRRNTVDGTVSRSAASSATSSNGSFSGPGGRSRFNSTFQSSDKNSPPLSASNGSGDFQVSDAGAHLQNLFSPHSPLGNGFEDRSRVSGKSMINDDAVDDETGELLKDPVAYAKNGQQSRRSTMSQQQSQMPITRFGSLSLNTNVGSGAIGSGLASARGISQIQSSISPTSINGSAQNGSQYTVNYTRPQYPPVNPADQNPPCNTLYVGNLPVDTSEDELKAVFSKQRGYKRLCFRTKQNGPMCFVEFDDISFATKALNELYGHPLHNSTKGGIRLSFSKNPLGVRSGQNNNSATSPQNLVSGYGHFVSGNNFSSVSGPPPGLSNPTGIGAPNTFRPMNGGEVMFSSPFGMHLPDFSPTNLRSMSVGGVQGLGNFGAPGQPSYSDHFGLR